MNKPCPVCNGVKLKAFIKADMYQLRQCESCGLIRTDEFDAGGTSYETDEYFVDKNRYLESWGKFCLLFDGLLDKITAFKKTGLFLDVGCGVGCLLNCAKERGFTAQGVEISPWAAGFAREKTGLDVVTGSLEEAAYHSDMFDVVVVNHVLEHVPDPGTLLREIQRIVKPDGLVVVGVPNAGSIMARLAGAQWASLRPEEHRWHFTPDTIKALVRKEGFLLLHFEARDNYAAVGWGLKTIVRRVINGIAVLTDRGEAMLVFATKSDAGAL
jgi:SAM-dependent methyltransferase